MLLLKIWGFKLLTKIWITTHKKMAIFFRERLRMVEGDRIAIQLPNILQFLLYYAVLFVRDLLW